MVAKAVKAMDASLSEQEFVELLRSELHDRSVAIVGSSPRLLEAEHGDLIDSHDVVIRFNDARIAGLGRHAGCRTDIRFVGCTINRRHEAFFRNLEEDSVVITKKSNRGKIPTAGIRDLKLLALSINKNAFALADVLLNSSFAEQNSKPPRTGFALLTYILASDVGLHGASLFGMERTARQSGRAHFYNDNQFLERVFKSHHLYHSELEVELSAFNLVIEKFPDLVKFY